MAEGNGLIFMGTSGFAATVLGALADSGKPIVAIYTRPDRTAGRGLAVRESAVKQLAVSLGFGDRVRQPLNFRSPETVAELAAFNPDFLVVAAYGLILPQAVLDIPAIAPINVHASLLPRYRGAAPIQRAIMENWGQDDVTGVSIMRMEAGLDTGPVYASSSMPLAGETTATLSGRLAAAGAELLIKTMPLIEDGSLMPVAQDETQASYAAKLVKEDGFLDWNRPAVAVDAHVRGVTPRPGAKTILKLAEREITVTVLPGLVGEAADAPAGSVRLDKKSLAIACADNWYELVRIIPGGRKEMTGHAFANGLRLSPGIIGRA